MSVCEKIEGKDGNCDVTQPKSYPSWEESDYSQMFTPDHRASRAEYLDGDGTDSKL